MVTFQKLKSGDWGVRIVGETHAIGDVVSVSKRDGGSVSVEIARILWSGDDTTIAAIRYPSAKPRQPSKAAVRAAQIAAAKQDAWDRARRGPISAPATAAAPPVVAPEATPRAETPEEKRRRIAATIAARKNAGRPANDVDAAAE